MIRVYIASKIQYAPQFRGYRRNWLIDGVFVNSRWIDMADAEWATPRKINVPPEEFRMCWLVDEQDVKDCQALIIYGAQQDKLRGALVEAGMAIAMGKPVFAVGGHPDFSSWQHHPLVMPADSFDHAKTMIIERFNGHARTGLRG